MIVTVASGKGGTGKTTVTASLAAVWDGPLVAVDLDVEEPNLDLFLHPTFEQIDPAHLLVPMIDQSKCTYCGACADLCQFAALIVMNQLILSFPEMCHGCAGCLAVCPEKAITPGQRQLGEIIWGKAGPVGFLSGRLRIGEAMSPPLMRLVKTRLEGILQVRGGDTIIDAPPGVSCPAMNAVIESDIIILVTEPTPFGVYDFQLACEAFAPLGKPIGVVINRAGLGGHNDIYRFCRVHGLPILAEIPYDRTIAEAYAQGKIISEVSPKLHQLFAELLTQIRHLASLSGAPRVAHA
jgi:MinD superfamily P-loop ATPase